MPFTTFKTATIYISSTIDNNTVYGGSNTFSGEWIQLNSIHIETRPGANFIGRMVTAGVMLDSNNGGNTSTLIHSFAATNIVYTKTVPVTLIHSFAATNIVSTKTVPVTSSMAYSTFRMLFTQVRGNLPVDFR